MAGKGGARPGAGRKPGGTNRKTRERNALLAAAASLNLSPREFFLGIMRDETKPLDVRMTAASHAIGYCHPRLSAIAIYKSPWTMSRDELSQFMVELRAGPPPEGAPGLRLLKGGRR